MKNNKMPDLEKFLNERNKEFSYIKQQPPSNKMPVVINDSKIEIDKIKTDQDNSNNEQLSYEAVETEKYIKPSDYLKNNVLPPMERPFLIDYRLSLDIRCDSVDNENYIPEYSFQFTKFGNISKVELTSVIISNHSSLISEPYLFLNLKEIDGRHHLANGKRVFGKIILLEKRDNHLIYVPEDCYQDFTTPISLDKITFRICDYRGTPINLREIRINRILKSKVEGDIIIECCDPHYLTERESIEFQIIEHIDDKPVFRPHDIEVKSIINEKRFCIKNEFGNLTNQVRIFRNNINLSATFKLSEINWFTLNDNSVQSCQLIRLSQLIKEKTQLSVANNTNE